MRLLEDPSRGDRLISYLSPAPRQLDIFARSLLNLYGAWWGDAGAAANGSAGDSDARRLPSFYLSIALPGRLDVFVLGGVYAGDTLETEAETLPVQGLYGFTLLLSPDLLVSPEEQAASPLTSPVDQSENVPGALTVPLIADAGPATEQVGEQQGKWQRGKWQLGGWTLAGRDA